MIPLICCLSQTDDPLAKTHGLVVGFMYRTTHLLNISFVQIFDAEVTNNMNIMWKVL